ncbi:MAG: hypothetical protein ACK5H1_06740 [Tenacibaculum sp.]
MKKKIILGLPKTFSFFKIIKKNIEFYGYEVISICYEERHNFKYKNFPQRAYNFFRKTFLNDKNYKNKLKFKLYRDMIESVINSIDGKVDYTLLIRADIYPIDVLNKLKKKSKKLIAYQWDGLHRFPAIYTHIKLFDRFFVFDKTDFNYKKANLLPLTNFYFDYDKSTIPLEACENDIYFIGSLVHERMPQIINFINYVKNLDLKLDINIFYSNKCDRDKYAIKGVKYINKHMDYEDNIKFLKNSKIIVDFLNQTHRGLSFRTFEALCFDKKLITNNPEVKNYDFYNSNNIFIWNGNNIDKLEEFINLPYKKIDNSIKLKYSFKNWLNYVLDTNEYVPINFPT